MLQTAAQPTPAADVLPAHHWLVAGKVVIRTPAGTDITGNYNTLLVTPRHSCTRAHLGRVQQILQIRMMKDRYPEGMPKDHQIVDVFLMSISHIGLMTEAEFNSGYTELANDTAEAQKAQAEISLN